MKLELSQLGFDCEYYQCQIEANNDQVWDGIRRKYWHNRDTYYLPYITWNQEHLGRKNKANGRSVVGLDAGEEEGEENVTVQAMDVEESNVKRQKLAK